MQKWNKYRCKYFRSPAGTKYRRFCLKMKIALKEANETQYWLHLLHETKYITDREFSSLHSDLEELLKILTAICKHYPQSNQSTCNL